VWLSAGGTWPLETRGGKKDVSCVGQKGKSSYLVIVGVRRGRGKGSRAGPKKKRRVGSREADQCHA